jgi:hypothetical protein
MDLIRKQIKPGVKLVRVPASFGIALGAILGFAVGDIILTRDELQGLMEGLLTSQQATNGTTRFSEWVQSNKDVLGTAYSSEIGRHFKWKATPR